MGRLIVHIGTHKTATTTIQHHLAANRKVLASRGIWYPSYRLLNWRRKGCFHGRWPRSSKAQLDLHRIEFIG